MRVIHPAQRTSRGSLDGGLWETVEQARPEPVEPIPEGEATDSDWAAFYALSDQQREAAQ